MGKRLFIYDFETNGLWRMVNQPIQVCVKVVETDGSVIDYNSYIKCPYPLSVTIERLTGITDELLDKEGKDIGDVFRDIHQLLNVEGTLVVGYNILRFDNLFLNHYMFELGIDCAINPRQCFDVAGQFKSELIGMERPSGLSWGEFHSKSLSKSVIGLKYKLKDAIDYYGVRGIGGFHNAKSDVEYTHSVFLKQLKKLGLTEFPTP